MGKDIECTHDMRRAMLFSDSAGKIRGHELDNRWNPRLYSTAGHSLGRIDTQNPMSAQLEQLEQGTVIAADIDDKRARRRLVSSADLCDYLREMLGYSLRIARKI